MDTHKTKRLAPSLLMERDLFFERVARPETLLALFDYLPDVFLYVKDEAGRFMKVNQTFLHSRGVTSEEEILGKTDLDIHPRYWGQQYRDEDQKVMESKRPLVDQLWLIPNVHGNLEPFVSTKLPLFSQKGDCVGIAGIRRPFNPLTSASKEDVVGIKAAVRCMNEKFADSIDMKELAKIAGFSHSQFDRRFKTMYRMSPSSYLQRVRVHEACRRLVASDLAASEIALQAGFYDQAHMTRTFKKILGTTPSEFRRMN